MKVGRDLQTSLIQHPAQGRQLQAVSVQPGFGYLLDGNCSAFWRDLFQSLIVLNVKMLSNQIIPNQNFLCCNLCALFLILVLYTSVISLVPSFLHPLIG